ncbi:MAG: hypothetical protein QOG03_1299 [Actinomycetota bacterium]|jgi:hypothetical protein|nr:hypothetical protein [Actinomycetota bacterium]
MDVVLGAVLFFVVVVGSIILALALAVRSLRRRNRVAIDIDSPAPISWLTSPATGPRLHRRLRDATTSARASVEGNGLLDGLGNLVVELERHAASIDRQLVVVEKASTPVRRRLRRELHAEVQMVESVSERLIRTTRSYSGAEPSQQSLAAIGERLDALDAAMADLARVERLGVGEAERVMRQRRPAT